MTPGAGVGRDGRGSAPISVEHQRGPVGLGASAATWAVLAHRGSPFFLRHPWYRNYLSTLEPSPQDVHFFTLRQEATPLAVIPLREGRRSMRGLSLRTLELPWHPEMPLTDIVAGTNALGADAAGALAGALAEAGLRWDVILWRGVPESGAAFAWSAHWPRAIATISGHRDYLLCDRPYEQLSAGFSRKFRANLRRRRNKLQAKDGVELRSTADGSELPDFLSDFFAVEASGWKGTGATAIQSDPRRAEFYRGVARDFGAEGGCEINLLRVGGKAIAGQFCLRSEGTVHLLKIGYDEACAALGPGNMLLEALLERSASAGVREVDLLTDTAWHRDWQPGAERVFEVMIFNRTARGILAYQLRRARALLRRAAGTLRAEVPSLEA